MFEVAWLQIIYWMEEIETHFLREKDYEYGQFLGKLGKLIFFQFLKYLQGPGSIFSKKTDFSVMEKRDSAFQN